METLLARGPLIRSFLKKPESPVFINTIFINQAPLMNKTGLDLGLQKIRSELEERLAKPETITQPKGKERFWQNLSSGFNKARQSLVIGAVAFSALAYVMLGAPPPDVNGDATPIVQTSTPTASTENKTANISTPDPKQYAPPMIADAPAIQEATKAVAPAIDDKPQTKPENPALDVKPVEKTIEEETIQIPQGSTAWGETRRMYVKIKGFEPTNTQIMQATIEFVKENDIAVKEWHIKGNLSDRQIQQYQTFKATGMIKRILQD